MADPAEWQRQIVSGEAPPQLKDMASKGLLPFPPEQMLTVLAILHDEEDENFRKQSLETAQGMPRPIIQATVLNRQSDPRILAFLAICYPDDEEVTTGLATNPSTPEGVLEKLAERGPIQTLEALANNKEKLRRYPQLIDNLVSNPELPAHLKGILLEEMRRGARAEAVLLEPEAISEAPEEIIFDATLVEEEEEDTDIPYQKRKEVEEKRRRNIYQMIREMNVGEKLILALRGNKEVRAILIRDANKQIALKVLESPRISEAEAEVIARMTNVSDDVLRGITKKKEWCRRYRIVKALALNPKTPVGISLPFVNKLTVRDLGIMARNRNIPEVLRQTAARLYRLRKDMRSSRG